MAQVTVIGLGYIGLPTSTVLATHGHRVTGVDINPEVVAAINAGTPHIAEPGLEELLQKALASGNFSASTELAAADIYLIIVPTPFIAESKAPDMRHVRQAAETLAPLLKEGDLVVLESTSPVGATRRDVADIITQARPELAGKLHFAFCPERAIPGRTLEELVSNDRTVGGLTPQATEKAAAFYRSFVKGEVLTTTAEAAEMVKLTENTFRDVNIAFANELSLVCDKLGLSVWEVIRLANHHPRVNILQPGPGVGGHCIAVDPWFIIDSAPEVTPLMKAARKVNDGKPRWVLSQVAAAVSTTPNPVVGVLGLAFKPDVDDLRGSPSLSIARALKQANGAQLMVCEPYLKEHGEFPLHSLEETLERSNILLMLTDHSQFKNIPAAKLAGKKVIDTRGALS